MDVQQEHRRRIAWVGMMRLACCSCGWRASRAVELRDDAVQDHKTHKRVAALLARSEPQEEKG